MEARTTTFEGITFENTRLLRSAFARMIDTIDPRCTIQLLLDGKDTPKNVPEGQNMIHFDGDRDVYYLGMGSFAVAYKNKNLRDRDQKLFPQLRTIHSPELQAPLVKADFDHDGKYWLYLKADLKLLGKTNTTILHGVILNPEQFKQEQSIIPYTAHQIAEQISLIPPITPNIKLLAA